MCSHQTIKCSQRMKFHEHTTVSKWMGCLSEMVYCMGSLAVINYIMVSVCTSSPEIYFTSTRPPIDDVLGVPVDNSNRSFFLGIKRKFSLVVDKAR